MEQLLAPSGLTVRGSGPQLVSSALHLTGLRPPAMYAPRRPCSAPWAQATHRDERVAVGLPPTLSDPLGHSHDRSLRGVRAERWVR
jgi:hypothetical protein